MFYLFLEIKSSQWKKISKFPHYSTVGFRIVAILGTLSPMKHIRTEGRSELFDVSLFLPLLPSTSCYLLTVTTMDSAVKLYQRHSYFGLSIKTLLYHWF